MRYTINNGLSKNYEAQKNATPTSHMQDKYLIHFDLQASLIWFAQQKVLRSKLYDPKVHDMQFRKNNAPKTVWFASRR